MFRHCLFNPDHTANEAAIGQTEEGKLFYQCFHDSCKNRTWREARQLISGNDPISERSHRTEERAAKTRCDGSVHLICASQIKPEPVSWIWDGYIAEGKVHIIAGPPGHGKTTLLLALLATLTIGGRWPDGTWAKAGDVAIWSGEDDPADTLIPRLLSCGADITRVYFISGETESGEKRSFDPATDIPLLRKSIGEKNIKMLVIDPIVSAVGGDSHKNAETRRSLQPIVDLASDMRCAVYGVTHFTKGTMGRDPVERVTGSLAFGALTRVVTVAMKLPDNGNHPPGARLFARAKSNISPDGGGLYYFLQVVEVPGHEGLFNTQVLWGDSVKGTAKELIAKAEMMGSDQNITGDAVVWLKDVLAEGPVSASDVLKAGKKMGYSKTTLHRAKSHLGIKSTKVGFATGWGWFLPEEYSEDSTEGSKHLGTESSGNDKAQVIDYVEDSTKVPEDSKIWSLRRFKNHEDSKGLVPSDEPLIDAGLGGVETTKIPRPKILESSEQVGIFDKGDEVII